MDWRYTDAAIKLGDALSALDVIESYPSHATRKEASALYYLCQDYIEKYNKCHEGTLDNPHA
jgi:hypothetical protein